ncbi:MAG: hypothetical protein OEX19_06095 [Gammaproteobacteria bacterium]|nr:hypothetical protein [Gammaproteobacteria bacterium]
MRSVFVILIFLFTGCDAVHVVKGSVYEAYSGEPIDNSLNEEVVRNNGIADVTVEQINQVDGRKVKMFSITTDVHGNFEANYVAPKPPSNERDYYVLRKKGFKTKILFKNQKNISTEILECKDEPSLYCTVLLVPLEKGNNN